MVLGPGVGLTVKGTVRTVLRAQGISYCACKLRKLEPFGVQIHRQYSTSRLFEIVEAFLRCIRMSLSVVEISPGVRGQGLGDESL